jgi:hypothetical protein
MSTKDGLGHSYEVSVKSLHQFELPKLDKIFIFLALAATLWCETGCASNMHN